MDGIEFSLDKFNRSLAFTAAKLKIPSFRQHQKDAIYKFIAGNDVFVSLPTNYGKSKIYQGIPLCLDNIKQNSNNRTIALVVSPIIAIIEQQVNEMNSKGIPALHLRIDSNWNRESAAIMSGQYSLVFGSPETFAHSSTKDLLALPEVRGNICGIFVDESHCVEQWGYSSSNTDAFRVTYSQLADLRALIPSKVTVMALTATATSDVRKKVIESLVLHQPHIISVSPDRDNIKYTTIRTVHKDPHKSLEVFGWMVSKLQDEKISMERLIVYCRSRSQCTNLYGLFEDELKNADHFAMCHGGTNQDRAKKVVQDFEEEDGQIRVLFATVAFGMGVDVKGTHTILHLGVPKTVGDFVQESGRVGRDGKSSASILLTYPGVFKGSRVSTQMKEYIYNKEECRRKLILKSFDNDHPEFKSPKHMCCDICSVECSCTGTGCSGTETSNMYTDIIQNFSKESTEAIFPQRNVLPEQLEYLEFRLVEYRTGLLTTDSDTKRFLAGGDITSGFPMQYIKIIIKDSRIAYPYEEFLKRCPMYDCEISKGVWRIMSEVFSTCHVTDIPVFASTDDDLEGEVDSETSSDTESATSSLHSEVNDDDEQFYRDYNYALLYSDDDFADS